VPVDKDVCEEWMETILQPVLSRHVPYNIFNADETGLYWRLLPDKTHAVSGEIRIIGKMSKGRVTMCVQIQQALNSYHFYQLNFKIQGAFEE